ncbi:MAG: phosphoglycolate phosphatase [Steroidobacteraceae bacterium]|jgi:phosphoglycolate phosphatase
MTHRPLWRGRPLDALLFDLDGTLLDTAGDITVALNRTLAEYGWAPEAQDEVRHMIGRGSPVLIQRTAARQGRALDEATQTAMVERFFHHYGSLQELDEFDAQPYPGVAESLRTLHGAGLRTAVVTNKQQRFASGLLGRLGLSAWVDLVVGGDSCERRKPDPQPLLFACDTLRVPASGALMVGDSINDVQAARGAGIPIVCVPYGYNEGRDPRALPCDALIESLADLAPMLLAGAP